MKKLSKVHGTLVTSIILTTLVSTLYVPSARAQSPQLATVLASQPRIISKTVKGERVCKTVKLNTPQTDAADHARLYTGIGALVGGTVLALATQNLSAGAQLAATGAGILAGGYAGKKMAEVKSDKPTWAFNEPEPKVTKVPDGAREVESCIEPESVVEVQEGYINLVHLRDQDLVVQTARPLTQGANIRVYVNSRGEMEILK